MQPWTLMAPSMMGQFPAAALIYRQGLVSSGSVVARIKLNREALLRLEGTPLPQEAALDELRLKDLPAGAAALKSGSRLNPLLHYVGRIEVTFGDEPGGVELPESPGSIDAVAQRVTSSTRELRLDYGQGVLTIDAPSAQGASGNLNAAGKIETRDLIVSSDLDLVHIVVVALDGLPVSTSRKLLLQGMSEERTSGFAWEPAGEQLMRISNIGTDPWLVRRLGGAVQFKRSDAGQLKVTALDANGAPAKPAGTAKSISLDPRTVYYLIAP